MSEVKWIKITTNIFDDEKMFIIEDLPDADAIIVIWFKLLCLAGKQNNSGVFVMSDTIPYTTKMLSSVFRRKEATVELALKTFEALKMIKIVDGVITIPNWGKHQSLDKLEERKAYMRQYMADYRKKQALIADGMPKEEAARKVYGKANSKANVSTLDKERELEEELDLEEEGDKEIEDRNIVTQCSTKLHSTDCSTIIQLFNETCPSYPKVTALSDARRKAIKARLRTYTLDDFKTVFQIAESSPFLKGANDRNWSANFDWLIKDANFAKVLDGNYTHGGNAQQKPKLSKAAQDLEDAYAMIADWAAKGDD